MKKSSSAGFTLIELLVVISIIGILAVALLPNVIGATTSAQKAADRANLSWHFQQLTETKRRIAGGNARWLKDGGHRFVLTPWVHNVVDRTAENRDRYFQPGQEDDPAWQELKDFDAREIWRSEDELTSGDTHYAGRSAEKYRGMWRSGNEPLMANDNEGIRAYEDGTIHVLMASGSVRELTPAGGLKEYWEGDDDDDTYIFPVGPNSPHPDLSKLEK